MTCGRKALRFVFGNLPAVKINTNPHCSCCRPPPSGDNVVRRARRPVACGQGSTHRVYLHSGIVTPQVQTIVGRLIEKKTICARSVSRIQNEMIHPVITRPACLNPSGNRALVRGFGDIAFVGKLDACRHCRKIVRQHIFHLPAVDDHILRGDIRRDAIIEHLIGRAGADTDAITRGAWVPVAHPSHLNCVCRAFKPGGDQIITTGPAGAVLINLCSDFFGCALVNDIFGNTVTSIFNVPRPNFRRVARRRVCRVGLRVNRHPIGASVRPSSNPIQSGFGHRR